MAKTAIINAPPPPAIPSEDEFEIALPDAEEQPLRLETDEPETPEESPPAKEPEAKKEPVKDESKAEVKPEPDAKEKERLLARAREERTKRKEYARRYETVLGELDRARQELARTKAQPPMDGKAEAYWKQRVAELKAQANEADTMGALAELTLNAFWQEQERRDRQTARHLREMQYTTNVALGQLNARVRHADYDEVLQRSGVQAAIEVDGQGQWKDPAVGKSVFFDAAGELQADPAERAYQIGFALLHGKRAYEEEIEGGPEGKIEPEKPEAKKPEQASEVEAERRGARRVVEQVAEHAKKPIGIRGIRSAGTPGRGVITFRELDRLGDENPAELARILKANPDLERRWLGG